MDTNEAQARVIESLSRCARVLVTTHARPDGDALGSCAAMALALRQKGIEAEVLLLTHLPRKYAFIFRENGIVYHDVEQGWPAGYSFDRYNALLVLDTGTWSQLPGLEERVRNWAAPKFVIDHHQTQEAWGDVRLVVKEAAAAGEIVADLLKAWGVRLEPGIAASLYLAIVSDTGWYQFSNTSPKTLRLAADLMETGIDTDRMYQALYQSERLERVRLQTRAMDSLELFADGRLAVMRISKEDFDRTGAHVPDTENLINIPLQVASVEACILLTETPEPGPIRVSLRSKGTVDMARFAEQFGGGGHVRAAGLRIDASFEEASKRVVRAMLKTMGAAEADIVGE